MTRNRATWRGLYLRQSMSLLMFLAFPIVLASAARMGTTFFRIMGGVYGALFLYLRLPARLVALSAMWHEVLAQRRIRSGDAVQRQMR